MQTPYESACKGKRPYPAEDMAVDAVKSLKEAGKRKKGHVLEHYKCRFCPYWHVGHRSVKRMRRLRREWYGANQ